VTIRPIPVSEPFPGCGRVVEVGVGLGEQRDRCRDLVDPPERGVGEQPSDAVIAPGGIDDGRPEQERGVRTGAVPFQRDRPDHGVADIGDEDDALARPSRGSPAPAIRARTVVAPRHGWAARIDRVSGRHIHGVAGRLANQR
jgi:hypothetical protein